MSKNETVNDQDTLKLRQTIIELYAWSLNYVGYNNQW